MFILKMKKILSLLVLAGLATAYTGDVTYYSAGLGSCGLTSTDSDAIVALSVPMVCIKRSSMPICSVLFRSLEGL